MHWWLLLSHFLHCLYCKGICVHCLHSAVSVASTTDNRGSISILHVPCTTFLKHIAVSAATSVDRGSILDSSTLMSTSNQSIDPLFVCFAIVSSLFQVLVLSSAEQIMATIDGALLQLQLASCWPVVSMNTTKSGFWPKIRRVLLLFIFFYSAKALIIGA